MTKPRQLRRGYTLFELVVVMAILLILAAIIVPSVSGTRGDTRQRAATDVIRGELAVARARAKEEGRPYRVAVSDDGARIRRAPDTTDFATVGTADSPSGFSVAVEYPFDHVTAAIFVVGDKSAPASESGWVTVATVQPDGTCLEDVVYLVIRDGDQTPLYIRVRGLTTNVRVVPDPTTSGEQQ